MRLRVSAGVPVTLLREMVQCVGSRLLSCHCGVDFCGRGATLVTARETQCLPALRGSNQRAAAPATLFRPPGRPCREESQTLSLIPFRILWIASAVGFQSTHARLRSPSRGGQPALSPTSAPGARDHCRQPAPCLQKPLEPETTAEQPSSRVYKSSSSCPLRATGPQVWNRILCPRPLQATGPASSKAVATQKTGTPGDNQSHSEPALPV